MKSRSRRQRQPTPGARPQTNKASAQRGCVPRYAFKRGFGLIVLLGLSSLLLLGCPARWKVVFVNATGQALSVQLSGAPGVKEHSFRLTQRASHSELLQNVHRLTVCDLSGALLFERDDFGAKDLAPPLAGEYPHIYVLLTATNAYVIPNSYAKNWREHIDEITRPQGFWPMPLKGP